MSIQARIQIERGEFQLSTEFTLPASGVSAIFGPSGCGKTTLLRAIAGLERCRDGYLKIGDTLWQDRRHFVPTHRRRLGYVFQEASLFPHLRVRGNLEYGLKRLPAGERHVDFDQAIALLGLEPLLARRPNGLSGGERQRVAIARALLTSPQLLLMDEPLAALDLQSKAEILPFLERLHAELAIPILYVSHAPEEVARLADHILLMEAGKIRASGPIAEIFTRSDLPLAHGSDAEAIIEGRVVGHDDRFHLTSVAFSGGRFTLARSEIEVGQAVRLRVLARDVSLTLAHQHDTSILNIFPAQVVELYPESPSQMTVRLNAGGTALLARITHKSANLLGLEPGKAVHMQVKSVALLG